MYARARSCCDSETNCVPICTHALAGKHPNKVKVACARETVGFVWESLNAVAA